MRPRRARLTAPHCHVFLVSHACQCSPWGLRVFLKVPKHSSNRSTYNLPFMKAVTALSKQSWEWVQSLFREKCIFNRQKESVCGFFLPSLPLWDLGNSAFSSQTRSPLEGTVDV